MPSITLCDIAEERIIDRSLLDAAIQKKIDEAVKAKTTVTDNCLDVIQKVELLTVLPNKDRKYKLTTKAGSIVDFTTTDKYELGLIDLINVKDDRRTVDCILIKLLEILKQKLEHSDLSKLKQSVSDIAADIKTTIYQAEVKYETQAKELIKDIGDNDKDMQAAVYNAREYSEADVIVKHKEYDPVTGNTTTTDTTDHSAKYYAKIAKDEIGKRLLKTSIVNGKITAGDTAFNAPFFKDDIIVFLDGIYIDGTNYGVVDDPNNNEKAIGITLNTALPKDVEITIVKLGGNLTLMADYADLNDFIAGTSKTQVVSPFVLKEAGLFRAGRGFDEHKTYLVGEVISYGGSVYTVTTQHTGAFDSTHFKEVRGTSPVVTRHKPYTPADLLKYDIIVDDNSGFITTTDTAGNQIEIVPSNQIIEILDTTPVKTDFHSSKQLIWDKVAGILYGLNDSNDIIALSGEIVSLTRDPIISDFTLHKFAYNKLDGNIYGLDDTDKIVSLNSSIIKFTGTPTAGDFDPSMIIVNEDGNVFTKSDTGTVLKSKTVLAPFDGTPTITDFVDTDIIINKDGLAFTKNTNTGAIAQLEEHRDPVLAGNINKDAFGDKNILVDSSGDIHTLDNNDVIHHFYETELGAY